MVSLWFLLLMQYNLSLNPLGCFNPRNDGLLQDAKKVPFGGFRGKRN